MVRKELWGGMKKMTPDEKIDHLRLYELAMYRIAKGILIQEEDCKDALQEAMIRAYCHMEKVKEITYLKTWVLRITINECNRLYKKRNQYGKTTLLEERRVVHKNLEEHWDLHKAIRQLEKKYGEPLVLYYFGDCSYEEIGQILKLPLGTVKSRIYYAKNKLKERLGEEYEAR